MLQPLGKQTQLRQVRDGLSQSMMLFEVGGRPGFWKRGVKAAGHNSGGEWPSELACTDLKELCIGVQMMNCTNADGPYSFHPSGANYGFGDGAVRFIAETIDPDLFISLYTMSGDDRTSGF